MKAGAPGLIAVDVAAQQLQPLELALVPRLAAD
jgi:hypothetical protein